MRFSYLLSEAWECLQAYRLRALLTMLGIIIGIGSVTLMVGIGAGSRKIVEDAIATLGSNLLIISPAGRVNAKGEAVDMGVITLADLEAMRELPLLKAATPATSDMQQNIQQGSISWKTDMLGVSADYFTIRQWRFAQGSAFDGNDEKRVARVVVLGHTVATRLFPSGHAVGELVKIGDSSYEVVGVLAPKGLSLTGRNQDNIAIAPYSTVTRRLSGSRDQGIPTVLVEGQSKKVLGRLKRDITLLLRDRHKLSEDMPEDFSIGDLTAVTEQAKSTSEALSLLLGAVAAISLVVGGIGIMNMMLVAVTERTREIGIRKALGATQGSILLQFLIEAVMISLAGSVLGLVAGALGLWAAQALLGLTVQPTLWSFLLSIAVAIGVGIGFGYYPARRAARLSPIEAVRYQ